MEKFKYILIAIIIAANAAIIFYNIFRKKQEQKREKLQNELEKFLSNTDEIELRENLDDVNNNLKHK